jgi:cyclopropane-fatty-acyl-phospholipid synthase
MVRVSAVDVKPTRRTRRAGAQDGQQAPTPEGGLSEKLAAGSPSQSAKACFADHWLARQLLVGLGAPPLRIVLWDGAEVSVSETAPVARVVIHDRATLWKLALRPRLEFGEAYSTGRLEIEGSLLDLLLAVHRATAAASKPGRTPAAWAARLGYWLQSNTQDGSKRHIHHHYDIGNDFYALWLDREMLYTCAYYPTPSTGLDEAQQAKMDRVCRKLWLRPGETVVEAGCGWGSLALYMARHCGVSVKAFNISREQINYARSRARAAGLDAQVEFIADDYRNITGRYDAFVSVGMLEHVGPNHYRELGQTIDRALGPGGRGLLHFIGQNCSGILVNPWIRQRIFPGAHPPGLREMAEILEPWRLSVLDVENLRLHYAQTLRDWLARFDAHEQRVREMFDPTFVRMWRLYLTGSTAAFLAGELQLFQVLFARPQVNDIPWTRDAIHQPARAADP